MLVTRYVGFFVTDGLGKSLLPQILLVIGVHWVNEATINA